MTILAKMAWKNLLAYKKRSIITLILVVCTTALMVFSSAFMTGSHETMIKSGVEIYPGYIQITHKDYRSSPGLENLIFDVGTVTGILSQLDGIETYGVRYESFVLYSHEDKAVAGLFTGIEPSKEQHLSRLKDSLVKGQYLDSEDLNVIYMGDELAKRLHLKVGDAFSFLGTDAEYSFTADNLTLKGTFKTGLYDFDASSAFVTKKYLDTVMATENIASHIIVLPSSKRSSHVLSITIDNEIGPEYTAEDWRVRLSGLVQAMKVDSIFGYITLGIIFLVIFFVIMIYTFLAVFTRVREVGILRAIGTTPAQVLTTFLLESIFLSMVSVLLGALIGGAVSYYFQVNPIDYSGYEEQFKQYGLAASAMPAYFSPMMVLRDMIIMFFLSILSTLYPIVKMVRFRPVEAMRHV